MFWYRVGFAFCVVLLGTAAAGTAVAQGRRGSLPSSTRQAESGEVTLGGVVGSVAAKKAAGAPAGLNFAISGSQHAMTVNAGTSLPAVARNRIQTGEAVQVTGVVRSIHGQDYLLAREIVVGGTKIQARPNGSLVRQPGMARPQIKRVESDLKGGAR